MSTLPQSLVPLSESPGSKFRSSFCLCKRRSSLRSNETNIPVRLNFAARLIVVHQPHMPRKQSLSQ